MQAFSIFFLFLTPDTHNCRMTIREVRLLPGESLASVEFALRPATVISGRVTDVDRNPLSGVRVELWLKSWRNGEIYYGVRGIVVTERDGKYAFSDCAPGDYIISADAAFSRAERRRTRSRRRSRAYTLARILPKCADVRWRILRSHRSRAKRRNGGYPIAHCAVISSRSEIRSAWKFFTKSNRDRAV
jgi:hypothetical protein